MCPMLPLTNNKSSGIALAKDVLPTKMNLLSQPSCRALSRTSGDSTQATQPTTCSPISIDNIPSPSNKNKLNIIMV